MDAVTQVVGLLCPGTSDGGRARPPRELTRSRAERVWGALVRKPGAGAAGGAGDEEALEAPLAGVGLAFRKKGADIHVTGLSSDGSAARSGQLYKGSIICKVEGERLDNLSEAEVISRILGAHGSKVSLTIRVHEGQVDSKGVLDVKETEEDVVLTRSICATALPKVPLFPGHPPAKQPEQRRKEALETLRATHQHLAQVLRARKQQQAHEEKQMRRRTAVLAQERAAVAQAQIISQRLSGILEPARLRWASCDELGAPTNHASPCSEYAATHALGSSICGTVFGVEQDEVGCEPERGGMREGGGKRLSQLLSAKERLKSTGLAAQNHQGLWTVAKKTSSLGGVVTGMACAESSPLPPPPSFSCAYQQEAGDEEDSHRSDATHHASDRQNRRAEQHAQDITEDVECARVDPDASLLGAVSTYVSSRQETGHHRARVSNTELVRHFEAQGGRAPAGGTVGAKSKPSDQSWDGGRKKLATDGDLMTLLAGRQRRLREAEDADAGLYFQQ